MASYWLREVLRFPGLLALMIVFVVIIAVTAIFLMTVAPFDFSGMLHSFIPLIVSVIAFVIIAAAVIILFGYVPSIIVEEG